VLWEQELVAPNETIYYSTKSGEHSAQKRGKMVELSFPAEPSSAVTAAAAEYYELLLQITEGLGIDGEKILHVGKNRMDLLIEIEGEEELLLAIEPNYSTLRTIDARVIIVTCLPSKRYAEQHPEIDFVSRCFAPAVGVDEDPVCGSAHCCLAPYWAAKLPPKKNGVELSGFQASSRGGLIKMRLAGQDSVVLSGRALTTMVGCVQVPADCC
jgi:PhzF family phenazine biosynthesis protein